MRIVLRVHPSLKQAVEQICKVEDLTLSLLIRNQLRAFVAAHAQTQQQFALEPGEKRKRPIGRPRKPPFVGKVKSICPRCNHDDRQVCREYL